MNDFDYIFLDGSNPTRRQFLFHVAPHELVGEFFLTRQGIHLSTTIRMSKELAELRGYKNPKYYAVKLKVKPKHALRIEADPLDWGADTIARLLLAKLNNKPFEAATKGFEKTDDKKFTRSNYKFENSPELIHIDNLNEGDRNFLERYAKLKQGEAGEHEFKVMASFLEKKGFDCIIYENYGETTQGDKCFIIFHPEWVENYKEIAIFPKDNRRGVDRNQAYFINESKKFINKGVRDMNKFLEPYGLRTIYIADYFEDNNNHIDDWVGAFCTEYQNDVKIFPIAINLDLLYKWADANKIDGKFDMWNIKNEINKTIAHEVGHGVCDYLESDYNISDEEQAVEDFADYYVGDISDSELVDLLDDMMYAED